MVFLLIYHNIQYKLFIHYKVNLWLKANRLSLNVTKTKCMFFHNRKTLPSINLSITNAKVETVIRFNYPGFMLGECLQ